MDTHLNEKLLTTAELARRLDVSRGKVSDLARSGAIPSVDVGPNVRRFVWNEVLDALRQAASRGRQEITA